MSTPLTRDFADEFAAVASNYWDTPSELLEATGLFIAGTALTWRVHMMSPNEITTNSYLIVTAPPGWFHKSSAVSWGIKLLRASLPSITWLSNLASGEAMFNQIGSSGGNTAILTFDEFRTFMNQCSKDYASQVMTMVTEFWGAHPPMEIARTKKGMKTQVKTVDESFVLNFIASTTTAWLFGSMSKENMASGFLSRFMIVESKEQTRVYAIPPKMDKQVFLDMKDRIDRLVKFYTTQDPFGVEFKLTDEAVQYFRGIFDEMRSEAMKSDSDDFANITSRLHVYVRKYALLKAALQMRGDNLVHKSDMEYAAGFCLRVMDSYKKLLLNVYETRFDKLLNQVESYMTERKQATERELYRKFHVSASTMDSVLKVLVKKEHVAVTENEEKKIVSVQWIG